MAKTEYRQTNGQDLKMCMQMCLSLELVAKYCV